ncbi:transporter substrate-binding domain-containing protein, partial [bacterium]|nr:transporter substrate-binding domain-containing protein [bacterium]
MTRRARISLAVTTVLLATALAFVAPASALAQEGRVLIVRGDNNYPPYEFLDDAGEPAGYNIDLVRAIANEADIPIAIHLGPWHEVLKDLREGRADLIAGMFRSDAREREFSFSHSHVVVTNSLFAREGLSIRTLADAKSTAVIVQDGDIMHDHLIETGFTENIIVVTDQQAALELLASGTGDCALLGKLQGLFHIHKGGLSHLVGPVGDDILPRDYCFAVQKGNTELLATLAAGHSAVRTSGLHDEIHARWFPSDGPVVRSKILKYAAWIGIPLVLLLAGALYWSWSLEREVARKTREIKRELTQRIRMEETVREREEQLRNIIQNMPVMVFAFDDNGRPAAWNAECERVTGYTADEIVGCDCFLELLYPDPDFLEDMMAKWERRGRDYRNWEWKLSHKDGTPRIVSWSNITDRMPIRGWGQWGIGVDITWLRDIESSLEYGEDRYRVISDLTS